MLTLYLAPGSSSMAPHIALNEIGVPFEMKPLSFAKEEQCSPAYLAINPEGKVPALLIDDHVLTEVAGILFYLAKRFPAAHLLPEGDIEAEARAVSWMSFTAASLHGAHRRGPEHTEKMFAIADRRLGERDWVLGSYSIADIHLFRLFWRFRNGRGGRHDSFPHLCAHYERMMARPAVQRTCEIEQAIGYELPSR
jgi:glutathione S-transferase